MLGDSKKIAFGGVMAAFGAAVIMLSSILQVGLFVLPAASGMIVLISACEINYKFSLKVYFLISVLSLMLSPDKSAALLFIALFGYYPILKFKIESIGRKNSFRLAKFMIKLLIFNAVMIAYYLVLVYLLGTPKEAFIFLGVYMPFAFLVAGNITFLMYDKCIVYVLAVYIYKIRNKLPFKIVK